MKRLFYLQQMIANNKGLTTGVTATQSAVNRFAKCVTERGATAMRKARKLAKDNHHLQLMLFLNLCKLMEMFPRQPEKLGL